MMSKMPMPESFEAQVISWVAEDDVTTSLVTIRVNDDDIRNRRIPGMGACQLLWVGPKSTDDHNCRG